MIRTRIMVLATGIMSVAATAAPVNLWFRTGNEFYESKHYDSAAAYYQKIIDAGVNNSAVYYNLGNTFFRRHQIGNAILYYEKAREIAPTDPDIQTNIRFANLNIVDRIPEPRGGFAASVFRRLHEHLPLSTQLWTAFGTLCVLSVLFSLALFVSRNTRLWLIYLSSLLIMFLGGLGISAGIKIYREENISHAIVLSESVGAMNEPRGTKMLFAAHEGTKLRIRKTIDSWSLVSLPNGVSGWVEEKHLGKI